MISDFDHLRNRLTKRLVVSGLVILAFIGQSACSRYHPTDIHPDDPAVQMATRLKRANADLRRFKCVGKMALTGPKQPPRSLRVVLAGELDDRLRIDMIAPFGGTTGIFSSNGRHLFLVMHPSREYYKKRIGSGSLRRLIQIDVTVGDLLELMVGRIPIDDNRSVRLAPGIKGQPKQLQFIGRDGRVRQTIALDDSRYPRQSIRFDRHQRMTLSMTLVGRQIIEGFELPEQIVVAGPNGAQATVVLERYEVNATVEEHLFAPVDPWS